MGEMYQCCRTDIAKPLKYSDRGPMKLSSAIYRTLSCMQLGTISTWGMTWHRGWTTIFKNSNEKLAVEIYFMEVKKGPWQRSQGP